MIAMKSIATTETTISNFFFIKRILSDYAGKYLNPLRIAVQIDTRAFPLADKAATALINAGASDGNTRNPQQPRQRKIEATHSPSQINIGRPNATPSNEATNSAIL